MTILVTGATGFIGSALVKELLQRGYSVPLPDLEYTVFRDYVAHLPLAWSTSWGRIWDVARESAAAR
jgi:nucleoside-diphosphate-sugar epimerase